MAGHQDPPEYSEMDNFVPGGSYSGGKKDNDYYMSLVIFLVGFFFLVSLAFSSSTFCRRVDIFSKCRSMRSASHIHF